MYSSIANVVIWHCQNITAEKKKQGMGSKWEWMQPWRDGWVMKEEKLFLDEGVRGEGGGGGMEEMEVMRVQGSKWWRCCSWS